MVQLQPDTAFLRALNDSVDNALQKCIQCGTCSAGCEVSPASAPFPRKEMAMAGLGMRDALLGDPDVWRCYQCNDCTRNCPRNARPGDVLAAIRQHSIGHFAFPGFWATRVARPRFLPLLLLLPAAFLGAAALLRAPLAAALNIDPTAGDEIVYSHAAFLPHWLLNRFFFCVSAGALVSTIIGTVRFRRALKAGSAERNKYKKVRTLRRGMLFALKQMATHDQFSLCNASRSRGVSHFWVFFGFLALLTVAAWIVTAGWNPLVTTRFVYPFSFLSPFKILANLGGAALLFGTARMIWERLKTDAKGGKSTYFDWLFLLTLFFIAVTGFAAEGLHYLRLTPHRHVIYFIHLVLVTVLISNLPFTKLAHVVYRTTAVVFAYQFDREGNSTDLLAAPGKGERDAHP